MNSELFPLIFVGLVVLIVVIAIASMIAAKKRREALMAMAQQLGFAFYPDGPMGRATTGFLDSLAHAFEPSADAVFTQRFYGFEPFGTGESPDVDNLLVGHRNGYDWYLFDYSYKTTSTNSQGQTSTTTHSFGVVAARVPIALPALSMAPENVFHRIGSKLGLKELTFELEEFNRRYFIRCADAKAGYDILHPQAIEYLMRLPVRNWQIGGLYALIYTSGSYSPEEMGQVMQEIDGFLALVPTYYKQDHGFTPQWSNPLD